MIEYEYGIRHTSGPTPHRTGMTQKDAIQFLKDWNADGGKRGVWVIIRRPLSDWEDV